MVDVNLFSNTEYIFFEKSFTFVLILIYIYINVYHKNEFVFLYNPIPYNEKVGR